MGSIPTQVIFVLLLLSSSFAVAFQVVVKDNKILKFFLSFACQFFGADNFFVR